MSFRVLRPSAVTLASFALLAVAHAQQEPPKPPVQPQSQAWEKLITPGLTYRMEIDLSLPRVIHALKYTPGGQSVTARAETALERIFEPDDVNKGRATLTATMARTGAIAGINGDFFPWTGDPIGAMVRNGELLSTPYPNRSVFGWGAGYAAVGPLTYSGKVIFEGGELKIDGVNQEVGENMLVLSTPAAGWVFTKSTAVHAILEADKALSPDGAFKANVRLFVPDLTKVKVEPGTMILSATGNLMARLAKVPRGQEVTIDIRMTGIDWSKAVHTIGGGPMLIKDGKLALNPALEKFSADFSTTKHPRTAIGSTAKGDIWMLVLDGRQPMSRGAGLDELARVMQRLGCTNAINLDGGGSSTIAIAGLVVNRPSGGTQRAISNSVLLFGDLAVPVENRQYVIKGVPRIDRGGQATYTIINEKGETVPNAEVIWAAQGSAWIDQGGTLRGHAIGSAKVSAFIRGSMVQVDVSVTEPIKPGN
ncbi:phosphodiester glycosidase family protein [Kamptonema cortianum]|nr:phosphodiester glycosidase family protein [Geitlerinema splendidum]MDK3162155.1 phosphodiester glycosidase family protein [Kamptonema cortianum]